MGAPDALLTLAIQAHGGRELWRSMTGVSANLRSGGFALPSRFKPGSFKQYRADISTNEPRTIISPHPTAGRRGVFERDEVRIETDDGTLLKSRRNPRPLFDTLRRKVWWDDLDAMYFAGYALWNYFCSPFLLEQPGNEVEEIEEWNENGEIWRRLRIRFDPGLPTHSREQTFYFDSGGLLRRLDYTAEVFGSWAKAAHYCSEHREFQGLTIPTRRQVFPRAGSGKPRSFPTLVWIIVDDARPVLSDAVAAAGTEAG